jgi:hypothetical protein
MTIQLKIWQCRRHIQQRRDILGRDSQHDREADCPFCTIEILQTKLLGKNNAEPSAEENEQFLKEYGSYANSLGVNTIAAYRLKVWLDARASLPAEQDADNSKLLLHAAELLQAQVSYVSMGFDHPPEIASSVDYDCEQTAIALRELAIANRKEG